MSDDLSFAVIAAVLGDARPPPVRFSQAPAQEQRQAPRHLVTVATSRHAPDASSSSTAQRPAASDFMANLASLPSYRHGRIEVDSLAELEAHLGGSPPKLMVVDEALLNTAAVPLLSRLERQAPGLPWIVAWDDPSERSFGLAMTFRARGCIDWHCGADHLHRALVAVLGGDIWFPRRMLQTLYLASISKQHDAATQPGSVVQQRMQAASVAGEPLTKREAETLTLIREGFSNKQISARLGISVSTVKKHVELTFEKCGLRHRRQTLA